MAKKKANPQTENKKAPKTQEQIPHQTMDDAASEKLDSLKSLNAMLLKEMVQRRQQVDSLTLLNGSLQSELNRWKSDKVSLQSELKGLTERAVMLEIEKGLVSAIVAVQVNQMAEVNRKERVAMEEKVGGLERDVKRVLEEKCAIEKAKNKKESEIHSLNSRLDTLVAEIGEGKVVLSQVCAERDEIRAQLDAQIQEENGLRLKLTEAEKREAVILEKFGKLKVDCDGLVEEKTVIERRVDSILREKDLVKRSLVVSNGLVDELKRDFEEIVKEKMMIEEERNVEEREKNELQSSVDGLNELVHRLQKDQEQLLEKVDDLEKRCVGSSEKEVEMRMEIDDLVKEKQENEGNTQRLAEGKSLVMKDLEEALKMLERQKLTIDQIAEEKMEAENAKSQGESNIVKMKEQLGEFKNTIVTLEKSSMVQIDKLKQLEAEVSHYRAAFDQATTERNEARGRLDEEKLNSKNLSEKTLKLEKGIEEICNELTKMTTDNHKLVAEKNEFENARAAMANDILLAEKTLAKTRKECDDTKVKLGLAEANSKLVLKILKNTSLFCQSKEDDNMGIDQENEFGEKIKHHVTELEAIKEAFKDQEGIVQELKRQLEFLKVSALKAHKGKSFWTLVSSATTVLAAVSLAYIARGH